MTLQHPWTDRLDGYRWTEQTIGNSEAGVFRLERPDASALFVKSEPKGPFTELPGEMDRLRWLAAQGIACPTLIDTAEDRDRHWLLMSALPGRDMASMPDMPPERIIALCADALRALRAIDITTCPFDHRLDLKLPLARQRADAGVVDETDFDESRLGRSAPDVFRELESLLPATEDLVVCHGDACFPNLMTDGGAFTGFLDCGRLGIADRYQDLALAWRSAGRNFGEEYATLFLKLYGIDAPDRGRIGFYMMLDEFF